MYLIVTYFVQQYRFSAFTALAQGQQVVFVTRSGKWPATQDTDIVAVTQIL